MDVGLYISELLKKNGEIIIPGVGSLVQARLSAYYNDADGKFYPPRHTVSFETQYIADDALAEYVAIQKHISLSSATYFTEKYVENLKHDILSGQVAVADLGWFYLDGEVIKFKPNEKVSEVVELYGFQPVEIKRYSGAVLTPFVEAPAAEFIEEHTYAPAEPLNHATYEDVILPDMQFASKGGEAPAETDWFPSTLSLEKQRRPQRTATTEARSYKWLKIIGFIVLALVILIGIVFALAKFAPNTYQKLHNIELKLVGRKADAPNPAEVQAGKADSNTVKADSALVKDTLGTKAGETTSAAGRGDSHFEVIITTTSKISDFEDAVKKYHDNGVAVDAAVDIPGPIINIKVGDNFDTFDEAQAYMLQLEKDKKIPATSQVKEVKPKK